MNNRSGILAFMNNGFEPEPCARIGNVESRKPAQTPTLNQSYDIIGDIHGHADELVALLRTLGYAREGRAFRHPNGRKAIFLGDFIDRGPKIREVLGTVRSMVEAGSALAVLGNHEINAMRFHTLGGDGKPLRPHTGKNIDQHRATLEQFPDQNEWKGWIDWFAGLPLFLDLDRLRIVHACWDARAVEVARKLGRLENDVLERYSHPGTAEYDAISQILNGPEARLPSGFRFKAADGIARRKFRVKWWLDLTGMTCREAIFPCSDELPELLPLDLPATGYPEDCPPTFFGHYAMTDSTPSPITRKLASLDYGSGKGGFLCAYRWDGEEEIEPEKFLTASNAGVSCY